MANKSGKTEKAVSEFSREAFEEFFHDYYRRRKQVYYLNFVRGIWFGFGSVLGGTLLIALLIWALSLFEHVPFLNDIIRNVQNTIESGR